MDLSLENRIGRVFFIGMNNLKDGENRKVEDLEDYKIKAC